MKTLRGWIAVTDELPRSLTDVLIALPDCPDPVDLGFLDKSRKWRLTGYTIPEMTVTHWMPLPEPPEVRS
jgi:hypothetical protein